MDLSPVDRAESYLDAGASTLSAARTLARECSLSLVAAREHVLAAEERRHREALRVRRRGAEEILARLEEITAVALQRQGIAKDGTAYDDPDCRAAVDAQKTAARILGLDAEDAGLRRAKARLAHARAAEAEHKAERAREQLTLDLRVKEARASLLEKARPDSAGTLSELLGSVLGGEEAP